MNSKTNLWKRSLALVMLLVMSISLFAGTVSAWADGSAIFEDRTGSIKVTKYATPTASSDTDTTPPHHNEPATGTSADGSRNYNDYTTIQGAKFELYKVADKKWLETYYNGRNSENVTLDTFYAVGAAGAAGEVKSYVEQIDGSYILQPMSAATTTGTTDGNGVIEFTPLELGLYVLVEVTGADQITAPLSDPCLISVPMVNTLNTSNTVTNNSSWLYNVEVYPKNHESTANVTLEKVDQNGVPLEGVEFKLEKQKKLENGTFEAGWTNVTTTTPDKGTTPVELVLKTGANGKITLNDLPSNLFGTQYRLTETKAPDGYVINSKPLYFYVSPNNTVTWNTNEVNQTTNAEGGIVYKNTGIYEAPEGSNTKNLTIYLRNEKPSLTKQVSKTATGSWKQDEVFAINDTIYYQLDSYIPRNAAELETIIITDTPAVGIDDADTSTASNYTIQIGTKNSDGDITYSTLAATNYTLAQIAENTTNGRGFSLTLNTDGKAALAGNYLRISYTAKMTTKAVIDGNGNGNTAVLEYTYDASDSTSTPATVKIEDQARVYTYSYQISKYLDSTTGSLAGGVNFELLTSESGTAINVHKISDGKYRLPVGNEITTTTLTTKAETDDDGAKGTIVIEGLDKTTYYLKETKTVDGYNLLSKPFAITVTTSETTTWNSSTSQSAIEQHIYGSTTYTDGSKPEDQKSDVVNKKGFVLPQTGSMGYLVFCAAGITLVVGGALILFGGRKKKIQ